MTQLSTRNIYTEKYKGVLNKPMDTSVTDVSIGTLVKRQACFREAAQAQ